MLRVKVFHAALMDGYTLGKLDQLLRFDFETSLEALAEKGSKEDMFLQVIDASVAGGWLMDLANAAYQGNTGNPLLRTFFDDHVRPYLRGERDSRKRHPVHALAVEAKPYFYAESGDINARLRELEILFRGIDGYNGLQSKVRELQRQVRIVMVLQGIQAAVGLGAVIYFMGAH